MTREELGLKMNALDLPEITSSGASKPHLSQTICDKLTRARKKTYEAVYLYADAMEHSHFGEIDSHIHDAHVITCKEEYLIAKAQYDILTELVVPAGINHIPIDFEALRQVEWPVRAIKDSFV